MISRPSRIQRSIGSKTGSKTGSVPAPLTGPLTRAVLFVCFLLPEVLPVCWRRAAWPAAATAGRAACAWATGRALQP